MVSSRKRALRDTEPEPDAPDSPKEQTLLHRIRNSWRLANLFQWIYLFGRVAKIDDSIDMEDLEAECLKPRSTVLSGIGLALLKTVSSHRGLTPELFDEYTRRQYVAKTPEQNPFGTSEEPNKFHDFDVFTKLRVLHQLTVWVMLHPERVREKMDEQKPSDQTDWRMEPCGWDSHDRTYYILDDNRLYRMTEPSILSTPPAPAWKPKKNTQKAKAAARASKRRRVSTAHDNDHADGGVDANDQPPESQDDGLGGAQWECVAVSLEEVQAFLNGLRKTRDNNEKALRDMVEEHLLPIFEKQEASRQRKVLQKEKELLSLEKMAFAKRSSRLANKAEQQKADEQAREEEKKRHREEETARKEDQKRRKMEKERDNRLMSREQRLQERETRRRVHEDELAQLSEDSKTAGNAKNERLSERRRQAEIDKARKALQEIEDEEEDWIFDCVCGVYGQVDDGSHSVSCERCNIWQHSSCLDISEDEADRDDFHFICKSCQTQRSEPTADAKPATIKLKVNRPAAPANDAASAPSQTGVVVELSSNMGAEKPDLSSAQQTSAGTAQHPNIPVKPAAHASINPPEMLLSGGANPFSSSHPTLSPPDQSPNKSRTYSTLYESSSPTAEAPPHNASPERRVPQKGIFRLSPKVNGTAQVKAPTSLAPVGVPSSEAGQSPQKNNQTETPSNTIPAVSPTRSSFSAQTPDGQRSSPPAQLVTPQLKHGRTDSGLEATPTLPPSQNGKSPFKRSPPPTQPSSHGKPASTPAPAIFPPVEALSPSPSQQIMTPPVKPTEPARPPSQQSTTRPTPQIGGT